MMLDLHIKLEQRMKVEHNYMMVERRSFMEQSHIRLVVLNL